MQVYKKDTLGQNGIIETVCTSLSCKVCFELICVRNSKYDIRCLAP